MFKCTLCGRKFDRIPADADEIKLRYGMLHRFKEGGSFAVHSLRQILKDEKEQEKCH